MTRIILSQNLPRLWYVLASLFTRRDDCLVYIGVVAFVNHGQRVQRNVHTVNSVNGDSLM